MVWPLQGDSRHARPQVPRQLLARAPAVAGRGARGRGAAHRGAAEALARLHVRRHGGRQGLRSGLDVERGHLPSREHRSHRPRPLQVCDARVGGLREAGTAARGPQRPRQPLPQGELLPAGDRPGGVDAAFAEHLGGRLPAERRVVRQGLRRHPPEVSGVPHCDLRDHRLGGEDPRARRGASCAERALHPRGRPAGQHRGSRAVGADSDAEG
mmetsp:Transcript_38041/g.112981  ORF Transcript_38041/g.112981 Transcript_38041/m.112981 type:complete len:212 (+) Transcript_38041:416-1051(+)